MIDLEFRNVTTYRYRRPVELWPRRLLLRSRESRELRLTSMDLTTTSRASLTWAHDVFGNAVATATFADPSDVLVIDSRVALSLDTATWPVFTISASASRLPFRYDDGEWADLGTLSTPLFADPTGRLRAWVQAFVRGPSTDTLSRLKDIGAGISTWISYQSRDDEGTQTPLETLDRGWGSCRDFAVLFADAVRTLGFGTQIVSGYLHDPGRNAIGSSGGARPTPGPRSMSPTPVESPSIRPIAASAAPTSSRWRSSATSAKRSRWPAASMERRPTSSA